MTTQASNALLKTLEEPLDNRFIIATSSNPNYLLDTIRSRATIIQLYPLPDSEETMKL
jgi:DNA polymerase-3 subunit delta'